MVLLLLFTQRRLGPGPRLRVSPSECPCSNCSIRACTLAAIASFAVCFCCGWYELSVDGLTVFAVVMAALLIGVSPLSLLLNGFAVVVHTTTPWPRPTPAGVATARGGESPRACNGAQREWKAPWSAQTQRSAVRKTGDTLAGASGQSPLGRVSKG